MSAVNTNLESDYNWSALLNNAPLPVEEETPAVLSEKVSSGAKAAAEVAPLGAASQLATSQELISRDTLGAPNLLGPLPLLEAPILDATTSLKEPTSSISSLVDSEKGSLEVATAGSLPSGTPSLTATTTSDVSGSALLEESSLLTNMALGMNDTISTGKARLTDAVFADDIATSAHGSLSIAEPLSVVKDIIGADIENKTDLNPMNTDSLFSTAATLSLNPVIDNGQKPLFGLPTPGFLNRPNSLLAPPHLFGPVGLWNSYFYSKSPIANLVNPVSTSSTIANETVKDDEQETINKERDVSKAGLMEQLRNASLSKDLISLIVAAYNSTVPSRQENFLQEVTTVLFTKEIDVRRMKIMDLCRRFSQNSIVNNMEKGKGEVVDARSVIN